MKSSKGLTQGAALAAWCFFGIICCLTRTASAAIETWAVNTTNTWFDSTKWSPAGLPVAGAVGVDDVYFGNNGNGWAVVDGDGAIVGGNFFLGKDVSGSGVIISNGTLTATNTIFLGYLSGISASIVQYGGAATLSVANGTRLTVGENGIGTYTQSGGTNTIRNLFMGNNIGSIGTYNLSGGYLSSAGLNPDTIGFKGQGTLTQTGGTYENRGNFSIANGNGTVAPTNNVGTYNLKSGTFSFKAGQNFIIGDNNGNGTWNIGDASGTASIVQVGAGSLNMFAVRNTAAASGTIRGWGEVTFGGALQNSGRIIADGYGTDRTLSMTNFSSVVNTFDNTTSNGWFAVNHGKLTLPKLTISSGTSTKLWGESAADTTPDLVNSVKLQLNSVTGGNLSISLLAGDRTDVPGAPAGQVFIGIWDFDTTGGFSLGAGNADLTFRFNDSGVSGAGLKLWHYNGASWDLLTSTFNDVDHTMSTTGVNSFSLFAITVPEPGSVGLFTLGILALLRRSRRSS